MRPHGQHLRYYLVLDETKGRGNLFSPVWPCCFVSADRTKTERVFHLVVFKELVLPKLQLPAGEHFADPFTETHSTGRREGWRDVNLQPQAGLCDGLPGRGQHAESLYPRASRNL